MSKEGTAKTAEAAFKKWMSGVHSPNNEFEIFEAGWLASQSPAAGVWALHYFREGYKYYRSLRQLVSEYDEAAEQAMLEGFKQVPNPSESPSGQEQGQAAEVEAAVKFADWLNKNQWERTTDGWWYKDDNCEDDSYQTTEKLYNQFKTENNL